MESVMQFLAGLVVGIIIYLWVGLPIKIAIEAWVYGRTRNKNDSRSNELSVIDGDKKE